MSHLVIFNPKNGTRTLFALDKRLTKIGRLSENDVTLNDDRVSRYHAEIIRQPDGDFLIQDLNSSNGTKVGGRKVSNKKLKDGDRIDIGRLILTFKTADLAETQLDAPPPPMSSDRTMLTGADGQDYATIIGGETIFETDTVHGDTAEIEGPKTVVSLEAPPALVP